MYMYALCSNTHWHGTCCDDAPESLHDFQLIHSLTHSLTCLLASGQRRGLRVPGPLDPSPSARRFLGTTITT